MTAVEHTGQEKRLTFQLYDYWFGLAETGTLPVLTSLRPEDIAPYKDNMVLMDLRDPDDEPILQILGRALQADLAEDMTGRRLSDLPRRTLLSRLTDHYMEVLGNSSPLAFEAEYNHRTEGPLRYRGIMLPFSDDGARINFILGAMRWITEAERADADADSGDHPGDPAHPEASGPDDRDSPDGEGAGELRARLALCRKAVQGQGTAGFRSRRSLYDALGAILDFHALCRAHGAAYHELLAAEGLKAQKRAPFTPVLKLCFGPDYDKTRLTEYAAALAHARKHDQTGNSLPAFLESFPGGIKGCVRAERAERNAAEGKPSRRAETQAIIDNLPPLASFALPPGAAAGPDVCLLLARRDGDRMAVLEILKEDDQKLTPLLNRIARSFREDPHE